MAQKLKKTRSHSTPRRRGEIRLSDSYGAVARDLGLSKTHVYLVCKRQRDSAELERKLTPYITGIGSN
jgi:hypothetical protein